MALSPEILATSLHSARMSLLADACEFVDTQLQEIESAARPFNIQILLPPSISNDAILLEMVREAYTEVGWRTEMRDATTLVLLEGARIPAVHNSALLDK